jgi:hypothetical protein
VSCDFGRGGICAKVGSPLRSREERDTYAGLNVERDPDQHCGIKGGHRVLPTQEQKPRRAAAEEKGDDSPFDSAKRSGDTDPD